MAKMKKKEGFLKYILRYSSQKRNNLAIEGLKRLSFEPLWITIELQRYSESPKCIDKYAVRSS